MKRQKILFFHIVAVCTLLYPLISGQRLNECMLLNSCQSCIAFGPKCGWCADELYSANLSDVSVPSTAPQQTYVQAEMVFYDRCDYVNSHAAQNCKQLIAPVSNYSIDKDRPLQGETRVSPQNITVNLRPGQPTTVRIRVKTPKDFPVDLYYLMDLSESMADDLQQIKDLGQILGREMKKVTSNFRLGFGAFVDKPLGPYTKTEPGEVQRRMSESQLQYTFGYKNYLPLDSDPDAFRRVVDKVKVSFNVDEPEGSLDALMQATVCVQDIGWRDKRKARRIIIVTTDATFHYAGDGLLGGAVKPNDGLCHLLNGNYTASKTMDYPSLSFLRQVMIDNEIVPIFATTNNTQLYKRVADFFGEQSAAVADTLEKDSSNVVPLIKQAYEKIAKFVSISVDPLEDLDVKITAICGQDKVFTNTRSCNDVALGEEIEFRVQLTAKSCSAALMKKDSFEIKTSFDNIFVKMKLLCSCDCENQDKIVHNATLCVERGDLICGQCECRQPSYGRFCNCNRFDTQNPDVCKLSPSLDCSGRGECLCGECKCHASPRKDEVFYGTNCQCSNATCQKSFGEICGGPTRGQCQCDTCNCLPDWTGPTCGTKCLNSTAGCFKDGIECSGKGECICGKCECYGGYVGAHCEECIANCPDPCEDYKECVRCRVFQTGKLKGSSCGKECKNRNVTDITKVDYVKSTGEDRCVVSDDDDCSFVFTYKLHNVTKEARLLVQKERICPAEPDILAIILGVIAGIVGIGLALLLIWKLLATIQDRREFAKFEKDRENARWQTGENPIFKQATSTFQNPLYGGQG